MTKQKEQTPDKVLEILSDAIFEAHSRDDDIMEDGLKLVHQKWLQLKEARKVIESEIDFHLEEGHKCVQIKPDLCAGRVIGLRKAFKELDKVFDE